MHKEIDQEIHRGLLMYIPCYISIKSLRTRMEIDPEIHMGLIVDLSFFFDNFEIDPEI